MKNVLFLVTGMTPQIITETVWALACDPNLADDERFVPDEIWVLSTDDGLNQIKATLFDEGVFEQFKKDYPIIAKVAFDKNHLCVIQKDGTPLKDLKTPVDNELSANLICQQVRNFTQDDNVRLHVSIAGGRKTMGFYAGYALSLYGRPQDGMSHVLVDSEFESAIGFYYPTQTDYYVTQRHTGKKLNAKDAQIWLANIPFVRMRNSLGKNSFVANATFSDVVNNINLANSSLKVVINELDKTVTVADKVCKLAPREFAFYLWFAKNKHNGTTNITRPIEGVPYDFADDYQAIYDSLGRTKKFDVDQEFFDQRNSYVKRDFKKAFGDDVAKKIGIYQNDDGFYECVLDEWQIVIDEV